MNNYTAHYISYGSSGSKSVKAASASDAKSMVESSGSTVYEVSGPEGKIRFMSYTEACEIQKRRR
jgi:hypothetical protein